MCQNTCFDLVTLPTFCGSYIQCYS